VFLQRFSCFWKYPLDPDKLHQISVIFRGVHDFTTFSKHNAEISNYVCNIEICEWEHISDSHLILHIKANRFVYGMVRALVGVMLDFARGSRTKEEIMQSLKSMDRTHSSPLAPARGLVLERVFYPFDLF
jgi:tRNA pseudouridine38-40 synthase